MFVVGFERGGPCCRRVGSPVGVRSLLDWVGSGCAFRDGAVFCFVFVIFLKPVLSPLH